LVQTADQRRREFKCDIVGRTATAKLGPEQFFEIQWRKIRTFINIALRILGLSDRIFGTKIKPRPNYAFWMRLAASGRLRIAGRYPRTEAHWGR